jgi:4-amino-4-deoxy-L-arabinose transferase-like glycosyltransferase
MVVVTYLVARRADHATASVAALFVATQPNFVRESHYVLTDVPMTCLVTLTLLMAVRAAESDKAWSYAWAGIIAGLAAATKYNGGLAVIMPLVAVFIGHGHRRIAKSVAALIGALAAFLIAAPYTWLAWPEFVSGFSALARLYANGPAPIESPWLTYLKHLRINLGVPLLVAAALGLVAAAFRIRRVSRGERALWAIAFIFVCLWFTLIATQHIVFARYLLPLLPPLLVVAACGVEWVATGIVKLSGRPAVRHATLAIVVIVVAYRPVESALAFDRMIAKTPTTGLAYAWILEHVPPGASLVVETAGIRFPEGRYRTRAEYRLTNRGLADYVHDQVDYVIATSQAFGSFVDGGGRSASPGGEAYRDLFGRLILLYVSSPSPDHPGSEIRVYRVPQ